MKNTKNDGLVKSLKKKILSFLPRIKYGVNSSRNPAFSNG